MGPRIITLLKYYNVPVTVGGTCVRCIHLGIALPHAAYKTYTRWSFCIRKIKITYYTVQNVNDGNNSRSVRRACWTLLYSINVCFVNLGTWSRVGKKIRHKIFSKQPISWWRTLWTTGIMLTKVYCIYIHLFREAVKVTI